MNEPQEGTQGAMKRIGEVLREHELGWSASEGFHCVSIICDWSGHDLDFPEHRAELIVDALGLTPEVGAAQNADDDEPDGWMPADAEGLEWVTGFAGPNGALFTRLVTKWEQQA